MIEALLNLDQHITLCLNGSASLYADGLMYTITSTFTWVPMGLLLLFILYRSNDRPRFFLILAMLVLCVFCSDQLSNICKSFFMRWRPARDPFIMYLVDVVNGVRGGRYGFFSAHSANTMSIAVFLFFLFRQKRLGLIMISWSLLNGWSRIYLGVHYFGDVVVGLIVGATVGLLLHKLYCAIVKQLRRPRPEVVGAVTAGGYAVRDVDTLSAAFALTYVAVTIVAAFAV